MRYFPENLDPPELGNIYDYREYHDPLELEPELQLVAEIDYDEEDYVHRVKWSGDCFDFLVHAGVLDPRDYEVEEFDPEDMLFAVEAMAEKMQGAMLANVELYYQ